MSAPPLDERAPLWDPARDDTLVCRWVIGETHDVSTFVFTAPTPRLFRFLPGQFLTFEFAIDGTAVSRCYTIASPPTRPDTVAITVKRKAGGVVSDWLHERMRPGMTVQVAGPMGDFTPALEAGARYLFLSAGSGITPVMSMTRTLLDLADEADVVFLHAARTPADIIFRDELALLAARGIRVAVHCTGERWPGLQGRLSLKMLEVVAPDYLAREAFVCGPDGYMDAVRAMLAGAGFDMARYHEESFDFARLAADEPEVAADVVAAERGGFKVELSRSLRTLVCGPDTFILDAARAAGLRLPSSCTRGVCGTCKSRLVSGQVEMQHGGGIRQREIDQGMILICCSRPKTDVVIER